LCDRFIHGASKKEILPLESSKMIGKKFMNTVANGKEDILQIFLDILKRTKTAYCIVGGLAVNAYVEPVVSLDLDVVIEIKDIDKVSKEVVDKGLKVERFEHSVNLTSSKSDLRIQIQTDSRYQEFLSRASSKEVLGYKMNVAAIEDVLQGKVWAYVDQKRRMSKRQKDLADIIRLIEAYPSLEHLIPSVILDKLK
jgi:hypothetical protein